jgi:hypothetical protein
MGAATRKLHKRLHAHRTFDAEQVDLNAKAPITRTVDPLLTMQKSSRLVAAVSKSSQVPEPFPRLLR